MRLRVDENKLSNPQLIYLLLGEVAHREESKDEQQKDEFKCPDIMVLKPTRKQIAEAEYQTQATMNNEFNLLSVGSNGAAPIGDGGT